MATQSHYACVNYDYSTRTQICHPHTNIKCIVRSSLVVQWLRLQAVNEGNMSSIPG